MLTVSRKQFISTALPSVAPISSAGSSFVPPLFARRTVSCRSSPNFISPAPSSVSLISSAAPSFSADRTTDLRAPRTGLATALHRFTSADFLSPLIVVTVHQDCALWQLSASTKWATLFTRLPPRFSSSRRYDLLLSHKDDLALLITLEQGKPLKEALTEVIYGANFLEFFAKEAKRIYGDIIPPTLNDCRLLVFKEVEEV
ncbi:hypothetical protein KSP40_PGU015418 [Platanthera guangdongensis]|uniref:Aldehyde dehydrogenase domain-containing protein n=1 Tax=Platanthera guangdongensis TaxID=2320717 RepID=A0ABR2MKN4_9ASPA